MNTHADVVLKLKAKFWNQAISSYHATVKLRGTCANQEETRIDSVEREVARAYDDMLATSAPTLQAAADKLAAVHCEFGSGDAIPAHDVATVLADLKRLVTA